MGGLILFLLLVLLVAILAMPALRGQLTRKPPPEKGPNPEPPHEVVVHKLDDHRQK